MTNATTHTANTFWTTLLGVLMMIMFAVPAQAQLNTIQYQRLAGKPGLNVFETPKTTDVQYTGMKVAFGGAFTQQFQSLTNENSADVKLDANGVNTNAPEAITGGFNLATANLDMAVQLADGVKVFVTSYMSARHHQETWVKGGYLQFDKMPFGGGAFDGLMEIATIRAGHFEVNYGDGHFRRTDNGNAGWNPFVGNYLMEAFTTEIGGEIFLQKNGLLGMVAVTGGEVKGNVADDNKRAPSFIGKVGIDKQVNEDLRVRLTGSAYYTAKSASNTLFSGDRGGTRYYSTLGGGDWSSRVNPGFRDDVTAIQINPFVKFQGLEFFGLFETASGSDRSVTHIAADLVYRLGVDENYYIGARYNKVSGELGAVGSDYSVDRIQIGGGWFMTDNVITKLEYVQQKYNDYPSSSLFHEGKFSGIMIEGVVAF